ncbi:hypothetical protein BYT27DRAFT_7256726 [Phlegmacium glaucopus]|nr:hypothetical protein BYT27DRAFT_7256726 [Phlegmacium glaucopus]
MGAIHIQRPPPAPEPVSKEQPSFWMLDRDDKTSVFSDEDEKPAQPATPATTGKQRRNPTRGRLYRGGSETEAHQELAGKKDQQQQASGKKVPAKQKVPPKSKAVVEDEDEDDGPNPQGPKLTGHWVDISDSEPAPKNKRQVHPMSGTMQLARPAPTATALHQLDASIGRHQVQLGQVAEKVKEQSQTIEWLTDTIERLAEQGLLYDILEQLPEVPATEDVAEGVSNSFGEQMDVDDGIVQVGNGTTAPALDSAAVSAAEPSAAASCAAPCSAAPPSAASPSAAPSSASPSSAAPSIANPPLAGPPPPAPAPTSTEVPELTAIAVM